MTCLSEPGFPKILVERVVTIMTKKHFEAMAAKFRVLLDGADTPEMRTGVVVSIEAFCDVAEDYNDQFGRFRFCLACGL
jgi:hypothetical protein